MWQFYEYKTSKDFACSGSRDGRKIIFSNTMEDMCVTTFYESHRASQLLVEIELNESTN